MTSRLPAELWGSIAAHACTDGGYTGRALSLTCRYFHAVVKPMRFHSVAIVGARRLHLLAERMACLPSATEPEPHIEHLFVSVADTEAEPGPVSREAVPNTVQDNYVAVMIRAAPHVRTLVVHDLPVADAAYYRRRDVGSPPAALSLPHLNSISTKTPAQGPDGTLRDFYPSLQRVHITQAQPGHDMWNSLVRLAPRMTHLRLSGLVQDLQLAPFLSTLLDIPPSPARPDPPLLPGEMQQFPPSSVWEAQATQAREVLTRLQCVWVQARAYTGRTGKEPTVMLVALERIVRDCEQLGMDDRLVVLPEGHSIYGLDEAKEDWLDLVNGGDGPWR